jgi:hypothetical protein
MAPIIYALCTLTALLCALLLLWSYARSGYKLLLWSGLCFAGLTLNNMLLVVDKLVLPHVDLSLWRSGTALAAMCVLLYGLIWDAE